MWTLHKHKLQSKINVVRLYLKIINTCCSIRDVWENFPWWSFTRRCAACITSVFGKPITGYTCTGQKNIVLYHCYIRIMFIYCKIKRHSKLLYVLYKLQYETDTSRAVQCLWSHHTGGFQQHYFSEVTMLRTNHTITAVIVQSKHAVTYSL